MIKLTVNPESERAVYTLDKSRVVIGRENTDGVDVPLNNSHVHPHHITIEEQNDCFIVKNTANDPFTSLNGMPFGKKTLKNFDQIEIEQIKITFEFVEENGDDQDEKPLTNPSPIDKLQHENIDIDDLLNEVDQLSKAHLFISADPKTSSPDLEHSEEKNLKEIQEDKSPEQNASYYLQDFDDESEQWTEEQSENELLASGPSMSFGDKWKLLAGLLIAVFSLSGVIFFGVYFSASGKNSQEEKKIAAGVADIAMAMTHAKLNHITPNKQNWSDPSFIRNNLSRVLPPNLHTQAQIDSEGQFIRYPYRLRVYTSRNMERFIIIAQPAPNFMQWLVHKKTIIVDSETMQMRKLTDLKAINRLLASPNPLEETNGEELRTLINEGQLMSLNSLSGHKNHWGFSPPKALGFLRPGAENYIYNAPRYYPFGEELLSKAVHIHVTPGNLNDVSLIQNEMEEVSKLKDIVLFTSDGLQMAIEAQHALQTYAPGSKFLVAYVKFNPKGFVASSHLLMNDEKEELAFLQSPLKNYSPMLKPKAAVLNEKDDSQNLYIDSHSFSENGDLDGAKNNHPLSLELNAAHTGRKNALVSISCQVLELLKLNNTDPVQNFNKEFQNLFDSYVTANDYYQHKISEELKKLYQEYSEMPLEEFLEYTGQAKLISFANSAFEEKRNIANSTPVSLKEALESLHSIDEANTLEELSFATQYFAEILSPENLPDPGKVIQYQEIAHQKSLKRLSELLQSPNSPYASTPLKEEQKESLLNILEHSWVRDPYEADYFISEFDQLLQSQGYEGEG